MGVALSSEIQGEEPPAATLASKAGENITTLATSCCFAIYAASAPP